MDDWQTIPLENALDRLIDYRGKSPPKSPTGVPVISAKVVKRGRILQPIEQTIDPNYYDLWMTRGAVAPVSWTGLSALKWVSAV